jgi:glutamyl-tRNA(Gln) amidotransferase subunit D
MVTQCLNGKVDLNVYSTGRELLKLGVIPLSNMLPETALVKFSHVLANYRNEEVEGVMTKNLRGEMVEREAIE